MMSEEKAVDENSIVLFDFDDHARKATAIYLPILSFYEDMASVVARIIEECLRVQDIKVHTIKHRAKSAKSFADKAATPSDDDPNKAKYEDPIKEITDLAGVRIIAYFLTNVISINEIIAREFQIIEKSDKSEVLLAQERFGYQSVHYLVKMRKERIELAEYQRFSDATTEIQVRTVLQHSWAEIEHDIQYKSSSVIPTEIRRRFMALAGLLEIADREFEAIQIANMDLEMRAKEKVQRGDVAGIEITPNSVKIFLNKKLGPDGRISEWSYDWLTRLLHKLGFNNIKQIDRAIGSYNDDQLSNIIYKNRQGQNTRLEIVLLAAMGQKFIERHLYSEYPWFKDQTNLKLAKLEASGIQIGSYDPQDDISEKEK